MGNNQNQEFKACWKDLFSLAASALLPMIPGPYAAFVPLLFFLNTLYDKFNSLNKEEQQELLNNSHSMQIKEIEGLSAENKKHLIMLAKSFFQGMKDHEVRLNDLDKFHEIVKSMKIIDELKEEMADMKNQLNLQPDIRLPNEKPREDFLKYLYYRQTTMKLVGRDQEKKALRNFANSDEPFRWWCVYGPGGVGKSHLALEWMRELKAKNWSVGFLSLSGLKNWLIDAKYKRWVPLQDTLIVVDYGANISSIDGIKDFFRFFCQKTPVTKRKIRLLILERDHMKDSLQSSGFYADFVMHCHQKCEQSLHHVPKGFELQPLSELRCYRMVIENILQNENADIKLPSDTEIFWSRLKNDLTDGGRPLYLVAAALAIAEKGLNEVVCWTQIDLLKYIIDKEIQYWKKRIPNDQNISIETIKKAIGFITLCNGLPVQQIENLIDQKIVSYQGEPEDLKAVLKKILQLKNDEEVAFQPLLPDLIGEYYLITEMRQKLLEWTPEAMALNSSGFAITLFLILSDFPKTVQIIEPVLKQVLEKLIKNNLEVEAVNFVPAFQMLRLADNNYKDDSLSQLGDLGPILASEIISSSFLLLNFKVNIAEKFSIIAESQNKLIKKYIYDIGFCKKTVLVIICLLCFLEKNSGEESLKKDQQKFLNEIRDRHPECDAITVSSKEKIYDIIKNPFIFPHTKMKEELNYSDLLDKEIVDKVYLQFQREVEGKL